jgi:hypothetical protein
LWSHVVQETGAQSDPQSHRHACAALHRPHDTTRQAGQQWFMKAPGRPHVQAHACPIRQRPQRTVLQIGQWYRSWSP